YRIVSELPFNVLCSAPVSASQSMTVRSYDPDASRLPSGENATDQTGSESPFNVLFSAPVSASQSMTVRSDDPDASRLPSGENATDRTGPEWPSRACKEGFQPSSTAGKHLIQEGI